MPLPSVDFELVYWRARRRVQRLRRYCRDRLVRARIDAHLLYLYHFGRLPLRPEPEETLAYRAMWAIVIAGIAMVIALDAIGEDEFRRQVDALLSISRPQQTAAAPEVDCLDLRDWSADTDMLKNSEQPST